MVVELVQSDTLVIHHRMCYITPSPGDRLLLILHYSYKYAKFCTFIILQLYLIQLYWYMLLFCLFKVERNIQSDNELTMMDDLYFLLMIVQARNVFQK